ncbi:MAG: T9SS type A sorting domain-containing protein, partial [Saprospiraceae bacterium]|nr:T9SS type A sorting domain-containing protein [Saprospiraceae bacterium]
TAIGDCGESVSESFEFQTRMISSVQEIGGATFLLSPNPAGERVRLLFSQPLSGEVDVSLFAVDGRLLQQFQLEAGQSQREITLDEYPGGVYLLQLSTPSAVATQRIVVQR